MFASCRLIITFLFIFIGISLPLHAEILEERKIILERGSGYLLETTSNLGFVFIADQNIAEVLADQGGDSGIFIYGKSIGQTTLSLRDQNSDEIVNYTIQIIHELNEVNDALALRFPKQNVTLNSTRGSIMVSGIVDGKRDHENILSTLKDFFPDTTLIDNIIVSDNQTVHIDVRLIEVNTSKSRSFGVDWSTLVSKNSISLGFDGNGATISLGSKDDKATSNYLTGVVDFMEQQGVATTLSRSNLSTTPGKTAAFNVGSEIAVGSQEQIDSTSNQSNLSVRYQFVGMDLEFVPEILPGNIINLDISVSLSSLGAGSRVINGNDYPNINKRSFKTKVSLENMQAFAIAGMSRADITASKSNPVKEFTNNTLQKILGKGSISQDNTELLLIVRPVYGTPLKENSYTLLPRKKTILEYTIEKKLGKSIDISGYTEFTF